MPPGSREIAESCLDLLNIELVRSYSEQLKGRPELAGRRVEAIGFQVGQQLVEKATKDRPRFADHLEVIKFICKDLWSDLFKKQVDNLKTNHRGTFVLQDTRFRWLTRLSSDAPPPGTTVSPMDSPAVRASAEAAAYLYFPCGLIKGALTNLGIPCTVSAEVNQLPASKKKGLRMSNVIEVRFLHDSNQVLRDEEHWKGGLGGPKDSACSRPKLRLGTASRFDIFTDRAC